MNREQFEDEVEELSSAEDFLNYFDVPYEQSIVHINRLHILQRFHDYITQAGDRLPEEAIPRRETYKRLLERAYRDFVISDALTEKVFKVFQEPDAGFVPIENVTVISTARGA